MCHVKQVLVLPVSLLLNSPERGRGSKDRLLGIDGRAVRMAGHVGRCYRLPGSAGCGPGGTICSDVAGSRMRVKRSFANNCHLKDAGCNPRPEGVERVARPRILRIVVLKVGHDTLSTVDCPLG